MPVQPAYQIGQNLIEHRRCILPGEWLLFQKFYVIGKCLMLFFLQRQFRIVLCLHIGFFVCKMVYGIIT